ncbi:hypothetical protein KEM55_002972 [Ascosphaera atra]|nr:hypothetical protein KEM55_002972 [Ascosphaera atra]
MGDEYSVGGGRLKLKGVQDKTERKKKKKAHREKREKEEKERVGLDKDKVEGDVDKEKDKEGEKKGADEMVVDKPESERAVSEAREGADKSRSRSRSRSPSRGSGITLPKTKAEMEYEEMRRKRLYQRLKREGVKTHKERVEELNKYLSNMSEHHDMPKIGPG